MICFTIPYPATKAGKTAFCRRFGLNAYYAGKHWTQRKKDAEELHAMTLLALRNAKIPRCVLDKPIEVYFHFDDGLDVDNHAVIAKAIIDALKGYLIPDDGRKWLRGVHLAFWSGAAIQVEIVPCA